MAKGSRYDQQFKENAVRYRWNIQNSHFRRQLRIWESVIPLSRRGLRAARDERRERTNTGIRELFQ